MLGVRPGPRPNYSRVSKSYLSLIHPTLRLGGGSNSIAGSGSIYCCKCIEFLEIKQRIKGNRKEAELKSEG